jgi:hypothetical protein
MREHDLIVINSDGRRFGVRIVRPGMFYGLDDRVEHDEDQAMVEFYDIEQDPDRFGERGQFVSRHYASTLRDRVGEPGLNLDGGVPVWYLDWRPMEQVDRLIDHHIPEGER